MCTGEGEWEEEEGREREGRVLQARDPTGLLGSSLAFQMDPVKFHEPCTLLGRGVPE
jgi:hypothetical protein